MFTWIIGFIIAFFIGIFAFSQIIGSIQNLKTMGAHAIFVIILWIVIVIAAEYFGTKLLSSMTGFHIGLIVSFVAVLFQGKIQ